MFDAPGSNIRAVYVDEHVVEGNKKAEYAMAPEDVPADGTEGFNEEEERYAGDASSRV